MAGNIVFTTAEDIVAVVDAVIAFGGEASKESILSFIGVATDDQVEKALEMSIELELLKKEIDANCYKTKSFLARKLVTAETDDQRAAVMRIVLEEYEPYKTFRTRHKYTDSIDLACRQVKALHNMSSNERDIKNTLISIATYAKALKSEGANLYSFNDTGIEMECIVEIYQGNTSKSECLRVLWGQEVWDAVDKETTINPLVDALQKIDSVPVDTKAIVLYAANSFESFLNNYAAGKQVSLQGKNGILQKKDALSGELSKKHRGMIEYIGQIRNASNHGADPDENGQVWTITEETGRMYPWIVATLIKDILARDKGIIEV